MRPTHLCKTSEHQNYAFERKLTIANSSAGTGSGSAKGGGREPHTTVVRPGLRRPVMPTRFQGSATCLPRSPQSGLPRGPDDPHTHFHERNGANFQMKISSLAKYAVGVTLAAAMLAACSSGGFEFWSDFGRARRAVIHTGSDAAFEDPRRGSHDAAFHGSPGAPGPRPVLHRARIRRARRARTSTSETRHQ